MARAFPEEFVTIRLTFLLSIVCLVALASNATGQIDSVLGQVTSSIRESYIGGISGNGRLIVFESAGDLATENPRNSDGNSEIFLFDYAQRRIFQITDTKNVLFDTTRAATQDNIRILIVNSRPVISNDGRWIAFSSNATTSRPLSPNATNPGSFDGNAFTSPTPTPSPTATPTSTPTGTPTPTATPTGSPTPTPTPPANPLTADANTEMWLYEIPAYSAVADLSAGDELPVTNLAGGAFTRVTNTDASQLPRTGSFFIAATIADDNHDASINDNGSVLAFGSTRDLDPAVGNPGPTPNPSPSPTPSPGPSPTVFEDNEEIFVYLRGSNTNSQITKTPRGIVSNPIYNKNPTISGSGNRVAFTSTGDDPIDNRASTTNFDTGSNPESSRNEEIFYADLVGGMPTGGKQITTTTPLNPGDPVNILDLGRRMSRDGRYIAFDSYADLQNENSGTNYTSFALYLHDTTLTTNATRRVGPRSDADTAASGGDVNHYPGFTDTDANGTPSTLVLQNRLNIKADGTIPTATFDGLNPSESRPSQIYSYPLNLPVATATFTRLAKFPTPNAFVASTQLIPSNSLSRMGFTLGLSELGLGNDDNLAEVYYFLRPTVTNQGPVTLSFSTGATRLPIIASASPTPTITGTPTVTPTPTATPTATPTSTPTATPTGTPTGSPTPTPTPVTPPAVLGMSSGMLAYLDYQSAADQPIVARAAVGSLKRRFTLPIELSGFTMTIDGAACGLKAVGQRRIEFVLPSRLSTSLAGTILPLVINNNGVAMRGFVTIVPARPDIFRADLVAAPLGRAKLFNVTNTVFRTEPFAVRTIKRRGNMLVPTVLRVFLTGVDPGLGFITASNITVRIRDQNITASNIVAGPTLVEPGTYTVDFQLPATLDGAGDLPIVFSVNIGGTIFSSRLDDTTSRIAIL